LETTVAHLFLLQLGLLRSDKLGNPSASIEYSSIRSVR
jgi:hypothetical protein